MASITAWKNGTWRARYRTPEGKSRSQVFDRKIDAQQFLSSIEHDKKTGDYTDPMRGRELFGDWWERWRATRVDLRPSTTARDESYARSHILPRLEAVPLGKIDRTLLRQWTSELTASGLAPATVVKVLQLTGKALAAAADDRLIPRNPAAGLALPKIETEEMRFLTPVEIETLADAIDPRYRVWALTAAYTGLRFGELGGLRVRRIDALRRKLQVAEILVEVQGHHLFGPPKTRAGRRTVPLDPGTAEELAAHIAGLARDDLVFTAPDGGPLRTSWRRRFFAPAVTEAGLAPLRPHDLRHTAVSLWLASGADPKQVAVWAGHSSVSTVLDRYGHLLPGREDPVMERLAALRDSAGSPKPAKLLELRQR